jgi:hypothetical protein
VCAITQRSIAYHGGHQLRQVHSDQIRLSLHCQQQYVEGHLDDLHKRLLWIGWGTRSHQAHSTCYKHHVVED